jgi:hypothetical protein
LWWNDEDGLDAKHTSKLPHEYERSRDSEQKDNAPPLPDWSRL